MGQRHGNPLSSVPDHPHVCSPAVRLERLAAVPLFAGLNADELADVDRHFRTVGFEADEVIYRAGAQARRIYVVATGAAKSIRNAADGTETILGLYGPGDFLGALPALGDDVHRDWAWTMTPSCLLGLDASDFDEIMRTYPSVALATVEAVSRRLHETTQVVHLLANTPLAERLAATLLALAEKVGRPWKGLTLLDLPLTRENLASLTGVTTESVSRVMSGWKRDGIIESGRGWIAVRDLDALRRLHNR